MRKSTRFPFLIAALILLVPGIGHAQGTWRFAPTFQRTPLSVSSESASGVKVLSSGKVLVYTINGGLMSGANGQRIGALVRVDGTTGAIDPTWHPDPTLTGRGFLGVAEAPDGKIYYATALVGDLVSSNPTDPAVNRLVRLNTDGSRDTTFNSPIFAYAARFLAVQPDGKVIVCAGNVNLHGVPPAGSIEQTVRLNTDGSLDGTFQSPSFQPYFFNFDIGVFGNPVIDSATGKIYFCGTFYAVNGQPRKGIVRCNADGTVDSSFVPTGLVGGSTTISGRAMVLQPGGKVVLGGNRLRTAAGGSTRYALLRFNNDGTLDSSFTLVPTTNSSGIPLVNSYFGPRDIHALPDGKILTSDTRVIRFLADGAVDSAFTPLDYTSPYFDNLGQIAGFRFDLNPSTGAAYLENPGPLYARLGGVPVGNITKLNSDGSINTQFNSPVVNSEDFAPDIQIATSGAVYVSGHHTDFGGTANGSIARLFADGTRDPSYALDTLPFPDKQVAGFALLPDSSAYVVFDSGSFNGGYQFSNLARLLPTGALDTSFRLSSTLQASLSVNAFDGSDTAKFSLPLISAAPAGELYVFSSGDPQLTVNTDGNLKPVRIKADGTENTSVPPLGFAVGEVTRDSSGNIDSGSTGYLVRLAETADGGFLALASVAPFPIAEYFPLDPYNYRVIKLRADGSTDTSFNSPTVTSTTPAIPDFPVIFDPVTGNTLQPPNGFSRAGDQPVANAAMLADGSLVLAGNFHLDGNSDTVSLAKLTTTGALDTSFNPPAVVNSARPSRPALITKARVARDGKIWVLGRFDTIGGQPAPGVARLNPSGSLDTTFQLSDVGYYDSFGDSADVVFADSDTAYLVGTFRRPREPVPFAVTRIINVGPLELMAASSRKTHGGAGDFSINLPLNGPPGVECRTGGGGGAHTLVFTFNNNVVSGSVSISGGGGSVSGSPAFSGKTMAVNLSGVTNAQTLSIALDNVTDSFAQVLPNASVSVSFLLGDTNDSGGVTSTDIAQTKAVSGQATNATNFRSDVNASGGISSSDIGLVKSAAGTSILPAQTKAGGREGQKGLKAQ